MLSKKLANSARTSICPRASPPLGPLTTVRLRAMIVAIVVHCEDVDLFSNEKNNNVAGVRAADYNEVTCQLGKPNKRFIFEVPLHDVACRI